MKITNNPLNNKRNETFYKKIIRTSERGRELGQIGGVKHTPLQQSLRSLKHGRQAKNPDVLKAITPTPEEKLIGIDAAQKIANLKKLYPNFASKTPEESLLGIEVHLGQMVQTEYFYRKKAKDAEERGDEKDADYFHGRAFAVMKEINRIMQDIHGKRFGDVNVGGSVVGGIFSFGDWLRGRMADAERESFEIKKEV